MWHSLGLFFLHRHGLWLPQDSREKYSLSYGRSRLVSVHLLTVPSLGLKIRRQRLAIDELISCYHSNVGPMSEHVE